MHNSTRLPLVVCCVALVGFAWLATVYMRMEPSLEKPRLEKPHPASQAASDPQLGGNSDGGAEGDRSYERLSHRIDLELRAEPLEGRMAGDTCDLTALAGFPKSYSEMLLNYTHALLQALHASPPIRRRFYQKDSHVPHVDRYPEGANPIYDGDIVVPLLLLPRPEAVRTWSASEAGQASGWRPEGDAAKAGGTVYGRTIVFEPGRLSTDPTSLPASPFEKGIPSWILYMPGYGASGFLKVGKLVLTPVYAIERRGGGPIDRSAVLHLGEPEGATLLGELITVPANLQNHRFLWTSIQTSSGVRRFLAYALLDGNGARRITIPEGLWTRSGISPYIRPLTCKLHQPRFKQHDELLLPTPMAWPPTLNSWAKSRADDEAHEEWCLDEYFPAQKDACWVIREAEDSKPLQESFLLMPAIEESDRPLFFIALFAETEPKQLITELAVLHKVSPNIALDSPETMARLNSLYEKVRDFSFEK